MDASTVAIIFGVLYGMAEALAHIPAIKANSPFQLILGVLAKLAGKSS